MFDGSLVMLSVWINPSFLLNHSGSSHLRSGGQAGVLEVWFIAVWSSHCCQWLVGVQSRTKQGISLACSQKPGQHRSPYWGTKQWAERFSLRRCGVICVLLQRGAACQEPLTTELLAVLFVCLFSSDWVSGSRAYLTEVKGKQAGEREAEDSRPSSPVPNKSDVGPKSVF